MDASSACRGCRTDTLQPSQVSGLPKKANPHGPDPLRQGLHRRHSALGYLSPDPFEHVARRRAAANAIAQDEVPNHPRGRLPTPGTRENPPSPVLAHQNNRGENHQPSARVGQVRSGSASNTISKRRSSGSFSTSDQERSTGSAVAVVCLLSESRYGFS